MPTNYHAKNPRGQQRDKIYREALRLELADMSEGIDLKKLREIARTQWSFVGFRVKRAIVP